MVHWRSADVRAEVLPELRQRHVDDGAVEEDHAGGEDGGEQRAPAGGVPIRRAGAGTGAVIPPICLASCGRRHETPKPSPGTVRNRREPASWRGVVCAYQIRTASGGGRARRGAGARRGRLRPAGRAGPRRRRATAATPGSSSSQLTVATAGSMKGYSRDHFPHWRDTGKNCDVRDSILQRDGKDVKLSGCNVVGGRWESVYDGRSFADPSDVDIDHMVPLANAWRSGADEWDDAKRGDFANDTTRPQLFAVSASSTGQRVTRTRPSGSRQTDRTGANTPRTG